MDLPFRMRIICNLKHCYAIHLNSGDKFLTSQTNLVLEAKASVCSTIKENLLLYCRKFSVFIIAVVVLHILITRFLSQRSAACNTNH